LESDDPIVQSGFSGGRERWVAERSPLVAGIDGDGSFLDVGCANGQLLMDVLEWCPHRLEPFGVDIGDRLIELARQRLPTATFWVADAWTWEPPRQWTFVYSLLDLAPDELRCEWLRRLVGWVEPGGRLIVGSYGGRTPRFEPVDVAAVMKECGMEVVASSHGGDPLLTRFAWTTK